MKRRMKIFTILLLAAQQPPVADLPPLTDIQQRDRG